MSFDGLTAMRISVLNKRWIGHDVWRDTLWVADSFWTAQNEKDSVRQAETWHHLVMTAGNFKRQGGTQVHLPHATGLATSQELDGERPKHCTVWINCQAHVLEREDPLTWQELTGIKGIGVATATTLLSALWPRHHIIIDQNDLWAAIAIEIEQERKLKPLDQCYPTWPCYDWFRPRVIGKVQALRATGESVESVEVERALYIIGESVSKEIANDERKSRKSGETSEKRDWKQYTKRVSRLLASLDEE